MLPYKVHCSCAVEKDCTDSTDHGAEGSCKTCTFDTGGIKTLRFQSQHCQRDTDIGNGTNVSGNSSARSYQSDVNDLHGDTDKDTGANIAEDETADQTTDKRTAQSIVTDRGTSHAGHG